MKLQILSREKIEFLSKKGFKPNTAVISITNAGLDFALLENAPEFLLQMAFDDVDNDIFIDELGRIPDSEEERIKVEEKYNMLSDIQAKEIADFYFNLKDSAEMLICQCEHGQSRSAAVAAAILEFRLKRGIDIFADDRFYPNKAVYKKIYNSLKEKKL